MGSIPCSYHRAVRGGVEFKIMIGAAAATVRPLGTAVGATVTIIGT